MSTRQTAIRHLLRKLARRILPTARRLPFARKVGRWLRPRLPAQWQQRIHTMLSPAPASNTAVAEVDCESALIPARWPGLPSPSIQIRQQLEHALLRRSQAQSDATRTPR